MRRSYVGYRREGERNVRLVTFDLSEALAFLAQPRLARVEGSDAALSTPKKSAITPKKSASS